MCPQPAQGVQEHAVGMRVNASGVPGPEESAKEESGKKLLKWIKFAVNLLIAY